MVRRRGQREAKQPRREQGPSPVQPGEHQDAVVAQLTVFADGNVVKWPVEQGTTLHDLRALVRVSCEKNQFPYFAPDEPYLVYWCRPNKKRRLLLQGRGTNLLANVASSPYLLLKRLDDDESDDSDASRLSGEESNELADDSDDSLDGSLPSRTTPVAVSFARVRGSVGSSSNTESEGGTDTDTDTDSSFDVYQDSGSSPVVQVTPTDFPDQQTGQMLWLRWDGQDDAYPVGPPMCQTVGELAQWAASLGALEHFDLPDDLAASEVTFRTLDGAVLEESVLLSSIRPETTLELLVEAQRDKQDGSPVDPPPRSPRAAEVQTDLPVVDGILTKAQELAKQAERNQLFLATVWDSDTEDEDDVGSGRPLQPPARPPVTYPVPRNDDIAASEPGDAMGGANSTVLPYSPAALEAAVRAEVLALITAVVDGAPASSFVPHADVQQMQDSAAAEAAAAAVARLQLGESEGNPAGGDDDVSSQAACPSDVAGSPAASSPSPAAPRQ